ncbi:ribonuclease HI [Candidatus Parcubacteria bacterium]|nr:ribonuclease HI [Candidatus Parcubacteria bacterium]
MKHSVLIYADGSAIGNPGPGGWGAIMVIGDLVTEYGGGEAHTTNNRMELTAVIEALNHVKEKEGITVRTDSRYLINGITKWAAGWEKSDWKGSTKKDILNVDLWKKILKATKGKSIAWEHVHGHAGVPGNERVDQIATRFSREGKTKKEKLHEGLLSKYPFDLYDLGETKPRPSKRKNAGKAYSYLSLVGGVAVRHASWPECERRVKGVSGARFKKALSPEDEENILRAWNAKL